MSLKENIGLNITVHSGNFHSDDVLCVVLWKIINAIFGIEIDWVRTRDPKKFQGIVADVGGGEYDHHGEPKFASDGRTHCGASLLWEGGLDTILFPEDTAEYEFCRNSFYKEVLVPVMAEDNGETPPYSSLLAWVKNFNPICGSDEEEDAQFDAAVSMAEKIILRQIDSIKARAAARVELKKLPKGEPILVLEKFLPGWQSALYGTACRIVIYPSQDGGYALCPRKEYGQPLVYVPDEWVAGNWWEVPAGLEFCHPAKFLITFGNLPDALAAARDLCGIPQPEPFFDEEGYTFEEAIFKEWIHKRHRKGRR